MIYVLAYPAFDGPLAHRLDAFRAAHEPARARLVRPHITLVFGTSPPDPTAFVTFCRSAVTPRPALPVTFDQAHIVHDPFDRTHKLVLTCGTGRSDLTDLQTKLYDGPHRDDFDASIPYRPHMTVATAEDRAALDRLETDQIGPLPLSGWIQWLDIVERRADALVSLGTIPFAP